MVNCKVKVVNASNNNNNLYQIKYIPFSISTIKLLIENEEDFDVSIIIKPLHFQNDDDFCGGFDDEKKGLKIIWGGGQEEGLQTILKGNEKKFLFLFVYPTENLKLLNYNLTLKCNKSIIGYDSEGIIEDISINLDPIETPQLINNIAHQKIISSSKSNKLSFEGNLVGSYYPRWYPELYHLFTNNEEDDDDKNYYQSDSLISNISFNIFKRIDGSDKDRVVLYFKENEIGVIEGDMDGANYHVDIFKLNNTFVLRLWFLWLSKKQFRDRDNLEPLQINAQKRGIFDNPELPDFERFDIIISSHGNILGACTDFHWQEYWYKLRDDDNTNMIGRVAKLFHPIDETLARLCNREVVNNKYENIIKNLRNITSLSKDFNATSKFIYIEGKEMEESIQNKNKMPIKRGKNFFRSHVPYIRNGYILTNMISHIVDKYQ